MFRRLFATALMMGTLAVGLTIGAAPVQAAAARAAMPNTCVGSWEYIDSDTQNFTVNQVTFQEHAELDGVFSGGGFCQRLRTLLTLTYLSCSGGNCALGGTATAKLNYETLGGVFTSTSASEGVTLSAQDPYASFTTATAIANCGSPAGSYFGKSVGASWACG